MRLRENKSITKLSFFESNYEKANNTMEAIDPYECSANLTQIFHIFWQNFSFIFCSLQGRTEDGTSRAAACRQFHQHFTYKFFVQMLFGHLFSRYVLALGRNSYEKFARKTLMKLTPEAQSLVGCHISKIVKH